MFPSDTRNGAYKIVKGSTALDNNYLQIGNVTYGHALPGRPHFRLEVWQHDRRRTISRRSASRS